MKLSVFNTAGEDTGKKVDLKKDIFGVEPSDHAIYLDVKQYLANRRQGSSKTKERAEITGSRRKIKRQKGTGTARAGNPMIAMASKYTIAEVFDIVEPGELDPEMIVTPGIFVDKIVQIPEDSLESRQRRMELVLERIKHRQEREAEKLAERGAL